MAELLFLADDGEGFDEGVVLVERLIAKEEEEDKDDKRDAEEETEDDAETRKDAETEEGAAAEDTDGNEEQRNTVVSGSGFSGSAKLVPNTRLCTTPASGSPFLIASCSQ